MDQTIALIIQAHNGDKEAREQVVKENVGLIWCIVKRFVGRGVETDDLFQIGSIGLLKAIDKFDLSFDVKFSTYAVPLITGEIKRFLRDDGRIKVSRSLKEMAYKAYKKREEMLHLGQREPSLEELANLLLVEKEELVLALESTREIESLHKPIYQKDGDEILLMDKLEKKEEVEETILNNILVTQIMDTLIGEEKVLIQLRYFSNLTQTEVGKRMGISQVQVSRMEKKILKSLRKYL